ncbi:MAG: cupin domain-containing protein [Gallionellaceae bacterium]|jgi:50S ribosomal protein L16 3-hydroxylase
MKNKLTLLGGLTIEEFLRDYWQKKPLLIRQAVPGFKGLLDSKQLIELACLEDAQARLVKQSRSAWFLEHGPFEREELAKLRGKWTVLVQGVNHVLPEATQLLKQFNFIPYARLDDLMVSYAPKGGGVGPHFDPYDVFLLQGLGHRRWQISTQEDRALIPGAPLRILQKFEVEQEWILEAGDMLYLPPQCGHNGIAEDDCMTYSIGFRTPTYQELAEQFLVYLQDRISVQGVYADPDLKAQKHPSEIGDAMLEQVGKAIKKIQWDNEDVANFLGSYLSEPKPHVYFDAPVKPLSAQRFAERLATQKMQLDLKTQMLCTGKMLFINGDSIQVGKACYRILRELADTRELPAGSNFPGKTIELLYEFYLEGFIKFSSK